MRLAISLRKTCSVSKGLAVGHMRITAETAACSIACHASAERDLDRCSRRSKRKTEAEWFTEDKRKAELFTAT